MSRKTKRNPIMGEEPVTSPTNGKNQTKVAPARGPLVDPKPKTDTNKTETSTKTTGEVSGPQGQMPTAGNDPEWYSRDSALLRDAASVPFSMPFGAPLDLLRGSTNIPGTGRAVDSSLQVHPIPGICTVKLKPSCGYSYDKTSPLNVCANALYTHVRYVNSGRKNYDPADLMIYALTFGEIYSYINWLIRIYNYAFMYSQRNWYIGKDLLLANNVSADNIVSNLANFRYWINTIINKISSFCVPADIYYFKRRIFLYANYYIENPYGNLKDQLYQFVPEGFMAFSLRDDTKAGRLQYKKLPTGVGLLNIDLLKQYFEETLMANITGDEDFGLMSGDIYKAYGDNIMKLTSISEDAGILPVHDPYVLSQFKNAQIFLDLYRDDDSAVYTIPGGTYEYRYGDIEQTPNGLLQSREKVNWDNAPTECAMSGANKILTVENPDPGTGDVIECSRLVPAMAIAPYGNEGKWEYILATGTEICVDARCTIAPSKSGSASGTTVRVAGDFSSLTTVQSTTFAMFKYLPLVYLATYSDANRLTEFRVFGNLDNTTLISNEVAQRLHEVALLSLFFVPGVAKLIS